jgi:hypothetical protein
MHKITKLENVPTSKEDIKEVLRELCKEIKSDGWRYLTHRFTCKLWDVIDFKGMATVH